MRALEEAAGYAAMIMLALVAARVLVGPALAAASRLPGLAPQTAQRLRGSGIAMTPRLLRGITVVLAGGALAVPTAAAAQTPTYDTVRATSAMAIVDVTAAAAPSVLTPAVLTPSLHTPSTSSRTGSQDSTGVGASQSALADDGSSGAAHTSAARLQAAGPRAQTATPAAIAGADGADPLATVLPPERDGSRPAVHEPRPGATVDRAIVVRPGDSLWTITARAMPDGDDAAIAAAWPGLYAANTAVIGDDPGLIRPGQRLVVPPSWPVPQHDSSP